MSDPRVLLVAEIHGRAGLADQLRTVLAELARGTLAEQDCVSYRVLEDEEPSEYVLLGAWSSEAGLRAHYDTPHYRHYRDQIEPLLARPSEVLVYHVGHTVHARDPSPPAPGLFG